MLEAIVIAVGVWVGLCAAMTALWVYAGGNAQSRLVADLTAALEEQWHMNHAEHCTNEWPHEGHCFWPRPEVLRRRHGHED